MKETFIKTFALKSKLLFKKCFENQPFISKKIKAIFLQLNPAFLKKSFEDESNEPFSPTSKQITRYRDSVSPLVTDVA